jgi:hypothetical protein
MSDQIIEIIKELKDPDGEWSFTTTLKVLDQVLLSVKDLMEDDHLHLKENLN